MDCDIYKQEESLSTQRIKENSKYEQCEVPQNLEQDILSLRSNIFNSFLIQDQIQFFESVIELNHFFNNFKTFDLKIIKIIWIPQLGNILLESLQFFTSTGLNEDESSKKISNNLLLIAKLLKDSEVQSFYYQSSLTQEIFKILTISENYDIIKQSLHVLIKTIRFFFQSEFPYNDAFLIFNKFFKLSATCERYIARCIKQITIYLDLSSFILKKKICDLCFFIIRQPKSKRSIKHILVSMQFFMRCDVKTNLDMIFNSKIISQLMVYLSQQEFIFQTCPCFLIPFLEFIYSTVYYGEYRSIAKIFKIVPISFFKDFYLKNESDHHIQSLVLKIFILRLSKSYCFDPKDQFNERDTIISLYELVIKLFEKTNFDLKPKIIYLTESLLDSCENDVFDVLIKNPKIFFDQFSNYVFDSKDENALNIYIHCLTIVFDIAKKMEPFNIDIFLDNFCPDLYKQFNELLSSDELERETLEKTNLLLEQVTDTLNKIAEKNEDNPE